MYVWFGRICMFRPVDKAASAMFRNLWYWLISWKAITTGQENSNLSWLILIQIEGSAKETLQRSIQLCLLLDSTITSWIRSPSYVFRHLFNCSIIQKANLLMWWAFLYFHTFRMQIAFRYGVWSISRHVAKQVCSPLSHSHNESY